MNTEDYMPITSCLSLSIRKEHKLMVLRKAVKTTIKISWQSFLFASLLILSSIVV